MKDWKGNVIKVGDIIQIFEFEDMFAGSTMKLGFCGQEGFQEIGSVKLKKHDRWLLLQTFEIIKPEMDGSIICFNWTRDVETPKECPLDSIGWNVCLSNNHAICIKDVSNNEMEHFLHCQKIG